MSPENEITWDNIKFGIVAIGVLVFFLWLFLREDD